MSKVRLLTLMGTLFSVMLLGSLMVAPAFAAKVPKVDVCHVNVMYDDEGAFVSEGASSAYPGR